MNEKKEIKKDSIPIYTLIEVHNVSGTQEVNCLQISLNRDDCIMKLHEEVGKDKYGYFETDLIECESNDIVSSVDKHKTGNTVKYIIKENQLDIQQYLLSEKIHTAIINMMKALVTNEWDEQCPKDKYMEWLSNGTGLDIIELNKIIKDNNLIDSNFRTGSKTDPFQQKKATRKKGENTLVR